MSSTATNSRAAAMVPADRWVAGYCSDAEELRVFLVDSRDGTLAGFVRPADAGKILTFRAGLFADAVSGLGRPDAPHGRQAQRTIRELAAREKASAERIVKGTAKGTLAQRRKLVHDEANGSLKAIIDTTAKLGHDDAKLAGEIATSEDCTILAEEMQKHYPSS